MAKMIEKKRFAYAAEGFAYGGDLDEDIGAVALLFDHLLEAADLTFDSLQAREIGASDIRIDRDRLARFLTFRVYFYHNQMIPPGRIYANERDRRNRRAVVGWLL